jgi:hypothetical protein
MHPPSARAGYRRALGLAPAKLHFGRAWMQPAGGLDAPRELHFDPA